MSDTNAAYAADEPFFHALLKPYRSLGRTGFLVLMGAMTFGWIVTGIFFIAHGAWPVFGFFGLDVLGLYIAFRLNYRAARVSEEVIVSRTSLDILKVAASGRSEQHHFNPFWARFSVKRHAEIGITDMAVVSREKSVPIGSFLNPDDRESFAKAFTLALATAKKR
ncbi:putative membrane protein [Mesorhizobium soli]|jgi:uncharacterized membrane protein|uniref:DUF2244 domain-containing protein n=1 Tax=Pseudaminobacter soli (ex Li et al. 2025) TaxID=1295366 RepID=UPI00247665EE|nr:DUF2244 domain-containing protein [Mesorhizobium soli]MDH6230694.1 putative membrane protein [Mesorhizobium soli]